MIRWWGDLGCGDGDVVMMWLHSWWREGGDDVGGGWCCWIGGRGGDDDGEVDLWWGVVEMAWRRLVVQAAGGRKMAEKRVITHPKIR
ncbi:hypothetical protein Tco_0107108 [Tanacetum coccineum]